MSRDRAYFSLNEQTTGCGNIRKIKMDTDNKKIFQKKVLYRENDLQ